MAVSQPFKPKRPPGIALVVVLAAQHLQARVLQTGIRERWFQPAAVLAHWPFKDGGFKQTLPTLSPWHHPEADRATGREEMRDGLGEPTGWANQLANRAWVWRLTAPKPRLQEPKDPDSKPIGPSSGCHSAHSSAQTNRDPLGLAKPVAPTPAGTWSVPRSIESVPGRQGRPQPRSGAPKACIKASPQLSMPSRAWSSALWTALACSRSRVALLNW